VYITQVDKEHIFPFELEIKGTVCEQNINSVKLAILLCRAMKGYWLVETK